MRRALAGMLLVTVCTAAQAGEAIKFTAKPAITRAGDQTKVSFTVSMPTDVEAAVLDAKGSVVRHLAAGLLGKSAPEPFKKDSLSQEILWDGKDDQGKPAAGSPFTFRLSIGAKPRLERHLGWDGATTGLGIVGLAVARGGELMVLESEGGWGYSTLRAYGKDGKYLRTIFPYPAGTPKERAAPFGQLDGDGESIPIVFNAHGGNTTPMTSGMKPQNMVFDARGNIILASAVGSMPEHGPARYFMAFHPQGGAAEGVAFPGPQISTARGMLGGAGERDRRMFDYMAASPDGRHLYFVHVDLGSKARPSAVYRVKWSDKDLGSPFIGKEGQPGAGDDQLSDVRGVAVDASGNLYVSDSGNNRVVIFSSEGRFLGKFTADKPTQIIVHPRTGEIYIVSRGRDEKRADNWSPKCALIKYSAWGKGEPKEVGRLEGKDVGIIALDSETSPVRLWAAISTGYARPQFLVALTDRGSTFEAGEPINMGTGLHYPMFTAADPGRNRVLVRERGRWTELVALDVQTGKGSVLAAPGSDIAVDRDGNIYVMDGRQFGGGLTRLTPDGKPAPFGSTGKHKISVGGYRDYGVQLGLRGHCVAPNGDFYVIRSNNYGFEGGIPAVVDIFGPDGTPKKTPFINGLGHGDCGIGVDTAGNVYLGSNLKSKEKPFPDWASGKVPAEGWVWWRKPREGVWNFPYYNPYLYHWGSVFKFGPEGGTVWGNRPNGYKGPPGQLWDIAKAPADAMALKTGYLSWDVRVAGAKWRYAGFGPVPTSDANWGDPACMCMTARLAVDEYGRVFVPDPFRFTVHMLDTAGNLITDIGHYGNMDNGGPGSRLPDPEIAFCWPAFVSQGGGRIFVTDSNNRRVTVVNFDHAAKESIDIK